jgi:hypothetical protein
MAGGGFFFTVLSILREETQQNFELLLKSEFV